MNWRSSMTTKALPAEKRLAAWLLGKSPQEVRDAYAELQAADAKAAETSARLGKARTAVAAWEAAANLAIATDEPAPKGEDKIRDEYDRAEAADQKARGESVRVANATAKVQDAHSPAIRKAAAEHALAKDAEAKELYARLRSVLAEREAGATLTGANVALGNREARGPVAARQYLSNGDYDWRGVEWFVNSLSAGDMEPKAPGNLLGGLPGSRRSMSPEDIADRTPVQHQQPSGRYRR